MHALHIFLMKLTQKFKVKKRSLDSIQTMLLQNTWVKKYVAFIEKKKFFALLE